MKSRLRPEDVRDINQTKPAKKADVLLKRAPYTKLTIHQFCLVRDFLIASLEFQNGQHPGPFETILLEDFQDAEIDQNSGTRTNYAPQHKTSTAGPAPISMSRSLSKKMEMSASFSLFLVSFCSSPIRETHSPRARSAEELTHFWEQTGKRPDIKITSTRMRKWPQQQH